MREKWFCFSCQKELSRSETLSGASVLFADSLINLLHTALYCACVCGEHLSLMFTVFFGVCLELVLVLLGLHVFH